MPTYEYRCNRCSEVFEVIHSIKLDKPEIACPKCGKITDVQRVISKTSFVLNGRRWSKDGYGG